MNQDGLKNCIKIALGLKNEADVEKYVETANNGQKAIEFCMDNHPDLIFMDINIPVMNGYDATTMGIRKMEKSHIIIIGLTGNSQDYVKQPAGEAEMDEVHEKPLNTKIVK